MFEGLRSRFKSSETVAEDVSKSDDGHWAPFGGAEHQLALDGKRADIIFGPDPFDPRMDLDTDTDYAMEAMHGAIAADALPYTKSIEDLDKTVGELYDTTDPDELRARIHEESTAFAKYLSSVAIDKT